MFQLCSFAFQFQALRAMVQANPQILQVFFFASVVYHCILCCLLKGSLILVLAAAYATGARQTKSSSYEIDSRSSSWFPSPDKWTCGRWRRV